MSKKYSESNPRYPHPPGYKGPGAKKAKANKDENSGDNGESESNEGESEAPKFNSKTTVAVLKEYLLANGHSEESLKGRKKPELLEFAKEA